MTEETELTYLKPIPEEIKVKTKNLANKVKELIVKCDESSKSKVTIVSGETPVTESITEIVDPKKCAEITMRMEGNDSVVQAPEPQPKYEMVDHPNHYNEYDVEVIDMMRRIWGNNETAIWCKLTAFKYRTRMGLKPENDINQDLKKEQWYLDKYHELIAGAV